MGDIGNEQVYLPYLIFPRSKPTRRKEQKSTSQAVSLRIFFPLVHTSKLDFQSKRLKYRKNRYKKPDRCSLWG